MLQQQKKNNNVWVYDIETLASCFTYTALNIDTQEVVQYVIHKDRCDLIKLLVHLNDCKGHIGFNNVNFDYPIIHDIINSYLKGDLNIDPEIIVDRVYSKAQEIINAQNEQSFNLIIAIKQKDQFIPQLDLFKVWHYNNKARATSLKSLEISMNYPNVMEMPISHTRKDITLDEISMILEYNLNDVMATYEFYKKSLAKIDLRKSLKITYDIPCTNWSDSKIGEQLILKLYCDKTGFSVWDVKDMRSNRPKIALNDVILPYIKYNSNEFNVLLDKFKNKVIKTTKNAIEESVIYKGFKYDYGTGGIHGCIKPGIYESDDHYMIIDADVGSLYPNLAIINGFYPEHLGEPFIEVYKSIIELRMKAKKEGNMVLSDGFKLAANSVYGKSNDIHSFLYDPKYTMATTLNGQLLLTLLIEKLVDTIPDLTMLQVNTDGITVKIPRIHINKYFNECNRWQDKTKLNLEFVEYDKMIIADVNNYIAVTTKGKIKNKGRFEVDKVVGSEPAYHKDNSFRIIPLALQEYYVNNIPVEQTIKNHTNIYDFCGRQKFKGEDYGAINYIDGNTIKVVNLQKNVRYYISTKGSIFIKHYKKGTTEFINKGFLVTIFNTFIDKDIKQYGLNYDFYIKECNKEINNITSKQLTLF
jgi:hypothetical protein